MLNKEDSSKNKREYCRLDTLLPIEVSLVPPDMKDRPEPKVGGQYCLKPRITNISGGGLSLRTTEKFSKDDLVEIGLALMSNIISVSGKVVRADTTPAGNYHIFIEFFDMPERVRERILSFVFQHARDYSNNSLPSNYRFSIIPLSKLALGTVIPTEIFIKEENRIKFLFDAGIFYDSAAREYLEERKISAIFINDEEMPLMEEYLENNRKRQAKAAPSFKDYSFRKGDYFRADKRLLMLGDDFKFSVFYMKDFSFTPTDDALQGQSGGSRSNIPADETNILIKRAELRLYKEYLNTLESSEKLTAEMLPIFLKERASIVVAEILSDPRNKENIQKAIDVVDNLITCLEDNPGSIYSIISLKSDDFYVYIHSVNVAAMCLRLGRELGMPENSLKELGIGALLHDIGYSKISEDIINKIGKLSINEYELLKTHVVEGGKLLRLHDLIPARAYEAILEHHEWLPGKAYPFNLPENKITLFGKLTAICDSYDIMTTGRFHKKPFTSSEALNSLLDKALEKRDSKAAEIVQRLFNLFD